MVCKYTDGLPTWGEAEAEGEGEGVAHGSALTLSRAPNQSEGPDSSHLKTLESTHQVVTFKTNDIFYIFKIR